MLWLYEVFRTPTSIHGVTEKNCTLAPRIVQGVDQVTTGIVMPRQLTGLVFRQPQSAVLATYRPSGRGSPAGRPTVSPGCVTDEAWAIGISTHSDSAPAAATLIQLSCIWAPDFAASSCVWNICCCFRYSAIIPTFSQWRPRLSPERPALILRRNHSIEQSVAS